MGRVQYAAKNIAFGWIGNITTLLLGAALRQIFIQNLGDALLGVNDYYTSILTVLSLAELGVGTAFNYSLYGPVAAGDFEKIKSIMQLYKRVYRTIAAIIGTIGLMVIPFLRVLIPEPGNHSYRDLTFYYLIFLFNTVSSYFVAYKYSLVNAEQKNYIQTNVITLTKAVTIAFQIIGLLLHANFYLYLLTAAGLELFQKIFVSIYLNRKYPYLVDKQVEKLPREEVDRIVSQTKALVLHKVGDVARLQTDNMIIAAFIDVVTVGFVGNYNYVVSSVSNFVNIIFNSVLSGFGNLIVTENKDRQYLLFRVYRFTACWIYGFSAVGFYLLLSPLVAMWAGESRILPNLVIGCMMIDYYFKGERIVLSNFKTAAGVFEQDKYLAIIQGVVNLIISIALVQSIGLVGIYIGTIISGLIANITKPVIIYKVCFGRSIRAYFTDSIKYAGITLGALFILNWMKGLLFVKVNLAGFILMFLLITLVYNILYLLLFCRTDEFSYLWKLIQQRGKAILKK